MENLSWNYTGRPFDFTNNKTGELSQLANYWLTETDAYGFGGLTQCNQ